MRGRWKEGGGKREVESRKREKVNRGKREIAIQYEEGDMPGKVSRASKIFENKIRAVSIKYEDGVRDKAHR